MSKKIRIKKTTVNNDHSNWNLTVSINKTDVHDNRKLFQDVVDHIFNGTSFIENWIKFRSGDWNDIVSFDINQPPLEIAPTTGYLHFHCVISVVHRANISLDKAKIDADFRSLLGYPVYSNFKLIPNYQKRFEDYSTKSIRSNNK